MLWLVIKLITN